VAIEIIKVPDIGGAESVDVIEVCVAEGDTIAVDDALVVVESDKASMDVPTPVAGKVVSLKIKEGDKVSEGDVLVELEIDAGGAILVLSSDSASAAPSEAATEAAPVAASVAASGSASELAVAVPDIGGAEGVDVIELCVAEGDDVSEGDSLIVLESDKASMEVPAPSSGKVTSISIKEGDKISQGDAILTLQQALLRVQVFPSRQRLITLSSVKSNWSK